jgi:N6-adenosine-specific RNA methylase IME4
MFPTQERIELFARRKTEGWSVWGLDMVMDNYELEFRTAEQAQRSHGSQKNLFQAES